MALSLEPNQFDRSESGSSDILGGDDDNDRLSHSMPVVGMASDFGSSPPLSHLAGIDETTAQRWEYEDKMVVLSLVLGSESPIPGA